MKLTLTARPIDTQAKEGWIIFVQNKKPLIRGTGASQKQLREQIKQSHFSGDFAQTVVFPTFLSSAPLAKGDEKTKTKNIILIGLGKTTTFRVETLERAAAAAVRAGKKAGVQRFATDGAANLAGVCETDFVHTVARGAAWGSYNFDTFKTGKKKRTAEPSLAFTGPFKNAAACCCIVKTYIFLYELAVRCAIYNILLLYMRIVTGHTVHVPGAVFGTYHG